MFGIDVCSGIVIGEYGSVTYSNASHGVGTVATVSCDPSYEPVNGFTTATCVAGAMWSPDVLQCDRKYVHARSHLGSVAAVRL